MRISFAERDSTAFRELKEQIKKRCYIHFNSITLYNFILCLLKKIFLYIVYIRVSRIYSLDIRPASYVHTRSKLSIRYNASSSLISLFSSSFSSSFPLSFSFFLSPLMGSRGANICYDRESTFDILVVFRISLHSAKYQL